MVRYRIIGFECDFKDNAWLSEKPMGRGLSVIKGKTKAIKLYKEEMKEVEKAIKKRGCDFEIDGKEEARPRKKVN